MFKLRGKVKNFAELNEAVKLLRSGELINIVDNDNTVHYSEYGNFENITITNLNLYYDNYEENVCVADMTVDLGTFNGKHIGVLTAKDLDYDIDSDNGIEIASDIGNFKRLYTKYGIDGMVDIALDVFTSIVAEEYLDDEFFEE